MSPRLLLGSVVSFHLMVQVFSSFLLTESRNKTHLVKFSSTGMALIQFAHYNF